MVNKFHFFRVVCLVKGFDLLVKMDDSRTSTKCGRRSSDLSFSGTTSAIASSLLGGEFESKNDTHDPKVKAALA
jgi:hypothetical protein